MLDRTKSPKTKEIKNITYSIPCKYTLDNGVNLYALPDINSEIIKLDIIFKAGNEFQSKKLNAVFANALLKEAPIGMSPDDIAETFDYYGSYIENFVGADNAGSRLFVATNFFDNVLPIFADLIKNPSLPEKEFDVLKNKYYQTLKNNLKKTRYLANIGLNVELFGADCPFSSNISLEDVENINLHDVKDFVKSYYRADNCYIMISGKITDEIIALINNYFGIDNTSGSWNSKTEIYNPIIKISESNESFKLIKTKEPAQSTICIGKNLGNLTDKDLIDISILNTILGGYFGSRLMRNIREDKGYTYGINSFIVEYRDLACIKIMSDTGVNVTQLAIDETFKEIKALREILVPKSELTLVKNFMMGEMLSAFDGVMPSSEIWQKLINNGKQKDFIDLQIDRIKNVTPENIKDCANRFLSDNGFHTVVAGNIE